MITTLTTSNGIIKTGFTVIHVYDFCYSILVIYTWDVMQINLLYPAEVSDS